MYGKIIKSLRLSKNLTQKQMANDLEIRQNMISQWETEFIEPNIDNLIILSRYFDVSVDYILGIEDESGRKMDYDYDFEKKTIK